MRRGLLGALLALALSGCSSRAEEAQGPTFGQTEGAAAPKPVLSSAPAPPLSAAPSAAIPASVAPTFSTRTIPLPGGNESGVGMDYLVFNPNTSSIWAPAGNSGSVDVIDIASGKLTRIEGFATQELAGREGKKRHVGPSSATIGDGVVYVGNRGDSKVCAVDPKKLTRLSCSPKLDSMPDGVVWVASTKEVWVTTPRDNSIRILDGHSLAQKARLALEGSPEGYAVDLRRGRFYTNYEDHDLTTAIDIASHKTVARWKSECGEDGPHGLRLSEADGLLFVACSDKVESMDVIHEGKIMSTIATGDGVDDLDFALQSRSIYVGAAKAAKLSIIDVDPDGGLTLRATVPVPEGSRNPAVDGSGNVYLSHSKGSELVVVSPQK